jgi:hypothetical protein
VSFFFVLSGFVLTWSHRHGEGVGAFYWHRFARVWRLATLTTLLLIALGSPHGSVLLDLALLHGWGTGRMIGVAANRPSWSLGSEAFFYLLFPLLLVLAGRTRRAVRTAAVIAIGAFAATLALGPVMGNDYQLYRFPPLRRAGDHRGRRARSPRPADAKLGSKAWTLVVRLLPDPLGDPGHDLRQQWRNRRAGGGALDLNGRLGALVQLF